MLKKTLLAYTIGFAFSPPANADGIEIAAVDFDRETLKSLGVDPNISHYFSRSARFLPGEYSLIVSVNGEKKGNIATRFDENGDIDENSAFGGVLDDLVGTIRNEYNDVLLENEDIAQELADANLQNVDFVDVLNRLRDVIG